MAASNRFAAARAGAAKEAATPKAAPEEPRQQLEEPTAPSKPRKKPAQAKRAAGSAKTTTEQTAEKDEAKKDKLTLYGFMLTADQNKALNRLKGIDGLDRSYVVRQALDEWIAAHTDQYPESLGQYGM